MDLQQLQSFVAVAEQASFTRAAQVLGVAQPALSRHIRSLEVELRQTLLTRNGRGAVFRSKSEQRFFLNLKIFWKRIKT